MTKARDIADGVDTADIADGAIHTSKIANNAINRNKIVDGAVTDAKIESMSASKLTGDLPAINGSALTGLGVADGSVTTAKLADSAVTDAKISGMSSSKLSGALPAIDGSALTGLSGGEAFPVGSVFISVVSTNPATLLGYGTWSAFATGRMLIGIDAGDSDFNTAEETGGAKTHTLSESEIPSHYHIHAGGWYGGNGPRYGQTYGLSSSRIDVSAHNGYNYTVGAHTSSTGSGSSHNNMPPYIATYMWKRTA